MRYLARKAFSFLRAALGLILLSGSLASAALAQERMPMPVTVLDATASGVDAQYFGSAWVDARGAATLEQALQARPSIFQTTVADRVYSLGEEGALWIHYRLLREPTARDGWLMTFPMPTLDRVTLYQQAPNGEWRSQTAGDTMAVTAWPEPGRYPHFRLDLPTGQARDIYVRIQNFSLASFPIQLMTDAAYEQKIQLEYLGLGLAFGALTLLIVACMAQSLVYRDGVYVWYALYSLVTTLAVMAYTGMAAHLLWPAFGALGDAPQGCLALLAAAAALLFVRSLAGISARYPIVDQAVYWTGLAGIGLAAAYPLLTKSNGLALLVWYVGGVALANLWIAFAAWRRRDKVGAWVLLAYLPISLAVGMALLRLAGWVPVSFATQYAVVMAMAVGVPLLLAALNVRSRDRHGAQARALALSSEDALTGLLAPHLFHDRLRQVVARYRRDKANAAVVFIDLVNYRRIKDYFGSAVAEQSLLRSVIKLRRLLRDVDTVSRIDEARFGLILEGVTSRIAVTDRAARLIAAGLMPLKGLKPDVTLQFHIAAALLDERTSEAPELTEALAALLAGMSARTRRPIRFLEPENTEPVPLGQDSSLFGSDSTPSIVDDPAKGAIPAAAAVNQSTSQP
jgi:diguanylate cyclase (GGDEF)-like protein